MTLPELLTPFAALYGRDQELAAIAGAWDRACAGSRQVLFVEGAAGEGKSSLVAHAAQAAVQARSSQVLFGAAHWDSYLSFEPFTLAINGWCTRAGTADLDAAVAGSVGPSLKGLTPALWARLPDLPDPPVGDVTGVRLRVVGAVTGFFENLTQLGPVLCVLDDLHWADDDTVGLLAELAAASPDWPMLVLATMRPAEMSPALRDLRAALAGEAGFGSVTLSPLNRDVTASVIADAVGAVPPPEVVAEIQNVTGGNALWIGEIARKLAGLGTAVDDLQTGVTNGLPDTLAETIKLRLDDLDPSTASVMAHASVLGSAVDPALLAELVAAPLGEVLATLKVAENRSLVLPSDGTGHFGFAHPLIESTLYASLDDVRLKRAHRRTGLVLEQRLGDQALAHASELAHHFTKAGPAYGARTFAYSAAAGKAAQDAAAYDKALHHFDTALSLIDVVDESQRALQEFRLTMGKGVATIVLRGMNNPRSVAVFSRVADLAEKLPVSLKLYKAFWWLWAMSFLHMDLTAARYYESKLLAIGELLPPGVDRLNVLWACMASAAFEGDLDTADTWARRSMSMLDDPKFTESQHSYLYGIDSVSLSYLSWSWVLNTRVDDPEKARAVLERGEALLKQAQEPLQTCSQAAAALARWVRRDIDQTLEVAQEGLRICDRYKIVQWWMYLEACAGWAQALRGDPAGAERCRDAADRWHGNGTHAVVNVLATMVTEASIAAEQPRLALRFVDRAFEIQSTTRQKFHLPSLIRAKAELAVLDHGVGDPRELYREALALARDQGARAIELQVALSMARWNTDFGHEVLAAAVERIGPETDLPDVRAARSLLGT